MMTVTGGRTVHELRGISRQPLDLVEPTRKGSAVTRSFGAAITFWTEMCEATASYAEKMRGYKVAADNRSSSCVLAPSTKTRFIWKGLGAVCRDDQLYLRGGGVGRAPVRTAVAGRLPV